jgi:hypothetical protein
VLELTVEVDGDPVYDPGLIGYGTPGQLVRSVEPDGESPEGKSQGGGPPGPAD